MNLEMKKEKTRIAILLKEISEICVNRDSNNRSRKNLSTSEAKDKHIHRITAKQAEKMTSDDQATEDKKRKVRSFPTETGAA